MSDAVVETHALEDCRSEICVALPVYSSWSRGGLRAREIGRLPRGLSSTARVNLERRPSCVRKLDLSMALRLGFRVVSRWQDAVSNATRILGERIGGRAIRGDRGLHHHEQLRAQGLQSALPERARAQNVTPPGLVRW